LPLLSRSEMADSSEPSEESATEDASILSRLREAMLGFVLTFLESIGSYVSLTASTIAWIFRPPLRIANYLTHMEFIGVKSTFIIVLTGLFSGMVLALQTVQSLRQFGAESNVSGIVAYSLVTEI